MRCNEHATLVEGIIFFDRVNREMADTKFPVGSSGIPENEKSRVLKPDIAIAIILARNILPITLSARRGVPYLVAIMDRASRRVLSRRLSNTMDASLCVEALREAYCNRDLCVGHVQQNGTISMKSLKS